MRSQHQKWKCRKGNCSIRWLDEANRENIKLVLTDKTGVREIYPPDNDKAEEIWEEFKLRAAAVGDTEAVTFKMRSVQGLL